MAEQEAERMALDYARPRRAERVRGRVLNKWGWAAIHAGYSIVIVTGLFVAWLEARADWDVVEWVLVVGVLSGIGLCVSGVVIAAVAAARPE